MSTPFGRVLTAMITPFDSNGAIDYRAVAELAVHLVENGSDGIVVAGTTGESPTLSGDEKVTLLKTVVDAVGARATVVAGTGTYDTAESIHLTEQACEIGCHGVMAVTPYYSRPPQQGLFEHFSAIADASSVPVLLYNIPSRTGRLIEVETLARLAAHERITAVKDAVGDLAFTTKTRVACPDDFAIYSGDDILTLPMMSVGAVGIVSVASHLVGTEIAEMVTAAESGDLDRARSLHLALAPLFSALFVEPNPIPVKAAMDALWSPVGRPRLPLIPAQAETVARIKEALAAARTA